MRRLGRLTAGIGLVAGFFGGWMAEVLMRFTDVVFAFPVIILAMAAAALVRPAPAPRGPRRGARPVRDRARGLRRNRRDADVARETDEGHDRPHPRRTALGARERRSGRRSTVRSRPGEVSRCAARRPSRRPGTPPGRAT
ncbi:hypothetical protein L1I79_22330 [Strepomyces sp. STD 3.1]|nr:hypothetical protein [Streptomyces sp. STD 3.1]